MATNDPLTFERLDGRASGTRILRLMGPLTLSNMFPFQEKLRSESTPVTILDLSGVPYMDSAGMGAVIGYFVSGQRQGLKLIAVGVNYRVIELFKITHVDTLITVLPTVEDAENSLERAAKIEDLKRRVGLSDKLNLP